MKIEELRPKKLLFEVDRGKRFYSIRFLCLKNRAIATAIKPTAPIANIFFITIHLSTAREMA